MPQVIFVDGVPVRVKSNATQGWVEVCPVEGSFIGIDKAGKVDFKAKVPRKQPNGCIRGTLDEVVDSLSKTNYQDIAAKFRRKFLHLED